MKPFTYLFTLAFGVAVGALVMMMFFHDDTTKSLDRFTAQLNKRVVCLPVIEPKMKP